MFHLTRISVHPVNSAKLLTAVEADADFQRESSAPMCVHPASEWCASQPPVRGSRVKTKATGFQHAYSALNTRATLAGRSVCRTVGSSHRQHPTICWMLVHTWGCVVWQQMRADLLRTLWQLKCLTMNSVTRNKVLTLCLLDYLCDPDNIFESWRYRVVGTFFRQFHFSI